MIARNRQILRRKQRVLLVALLISFVLSVVSAEFAARVFFAYRYDLSDFIVRGGGANPIKLDSYEVMSSKAPWHWSLRPGYGMSTDALIREKREDRKSISLQALLKDKGKTGLPSYGGLQVNSDGFKGPEIDTRKRGLRLLLVGDSTTFGFGPFDYSSAMRWQFSTQSQTVEVINGGVEGYSIRNVMLEMDRFTSLKSNVVVLYIGWNDLFSDVSATCRSCRYSRLLYLVKYYFARQTYPTLQGRANLEDPDIRKIGNYKPEFAAQLEHVIRRLKSAETKLFLVTLPGLYFTGKEQLPEVSGIAHLPSFTDNPVVLAKLTQAYNDEVRRVAQKTNIGLIDLSLWSVEELAPRHKYFLDSVHINALGLSKIGIYLAQIISSELDN